MVNPISPKDVGSAKATIFPKCVFEAVNELIATHYTNGRAHFTQDDVIDKIQHYSGYDIGRKEIFDNGYLNFEEVYREQGWKVEYDKPGYNESYKANFTFKAK